MSRMTACMTFVPHVAAHILVLNHPQVEREEGDEPSEGEPVVQLNRWHHWVQKRACEGVLQVQVPPVLCSVQEGENIPYGSQDALGGIELCPPSPLPADVTWEGREGVLRWREGARRGSPLAAERGS